MTVLTSEILLKILKGDYKGQESEYKKYYRKSKFSDGVEIFINDVVVEGELKINEVIIVEDLVKIENTAFHNDFTLDNIIFKKHFGLISNTFNGRVTFYGKSFSSISICRSIFKDSINFEGGEYLSVGIYDITSEYLCIFGGNFTNSFSIQSENIKKILIANSDTFITLNPQAI